MLRFLQRIICRLKRTVACTTDHYLIRQDLLGQTKMSSVLLIFLCVLLSVQALRPSLFGTRTQKQTNNHYI